MWQLLADIATTVGIGVALVSAVVGSVLTWRGQRQERAIADAAASRVESAAALSEQYTQRVVDALEELARKEFGAVVPEPAVVGVRWQLTHRQGDQYLLENVGDEVAAEVSVSADDTMMLRAGVTPRVGPGEAVTFVAVASMGTRDRTISVRWTGIGGQGVGEWRYPLPARPSRR